jgi:hypothetical protein
VRLEPAPYPIAPARLRDVVIDVANWLGWEHWVDASGQAMHLIPPDAAPITVAIAQCPAPARVSIDCHETQEAVARILIDELHGAILRRTNQERNPT